MAASCFACGAEVPAGGPVGRRDTCPSCDAGLHACVNCRHYDPAAARECREPHAERILDKEASNFCDLFQLGDGASRRGGPQGAARDALAALFGEAPRPAPDPRGDLEALFRKKK